MYSSPKLPVPTSFRAGQSCAARKRRAINPALGKLLAHALEGGKQRPVKEGTLRIDGKATALERDIARTLLRNRYDERLASASNVLLANVHPLRAPWGKALAHAHKLRPIGADKNKRLVRQERIGRGTRVPNIGRGVSVLRTLVQVPEHHARRARPGRVRDMGKRRVRSKALGPAGAEAADGAAKAPVCDQLIEEGDTSGRRVLQAHNARSEGNEVCNRCRGVGGIDTRAHAPTTPSNPSTSSNRSERRNVIAKSKGAPLDFATLASASDRAATSMPAATPRETAASSPRAPMPSASIRQSGRCTSKKRDSAAASKVPASSKSSPHFRCERTPCAPAFQTPFRAGSRSRDARPHASDEHDLTVGFFHIRSTFLRERRRTMRRLPCTIIISRRRPATWYAAEGLTPRESVRPQKERGG